MAGTSCNVESAELNAEWLYDADRLRCVKRQSAPTRAPKPASYLQWRQVLKGNLTKVDGTDRVVLTDQHRALYEPVQCIDLGSCGVANGRLRMLRFCQKTEFDA